MSLLPRLLDLPGLILEGLLGSGRSPSFPRVSPREAAAEVIQSTRANAFLALETDGVERYRVDGRVFGVARAGRAAFVVGGLQGEGEGAEGALIELTRELRRSG